MEYSLETLGYIHSPFKQKFAIPRQPGLANAKGYIEFVSPFNNENMLDGTEGYSHLWLLFVFHKNIEKGWKARVKAPRLGGNATTGVFATRATHRPNSIGMSVVKNLGVEKTPTGTILRVSGVDLVDQTPIVDIKPYIPYADCVKEATAEITQKASIPSLPVTYSQVAAAQLKVHASHYPDLAELVENILAQDPRPAYRHSLSHDPRIYKVALYNLDVCWRVEGGGVVVTEIAQVSAE